jgi:hypothetical protein
MEINVPLVARGICFAYLHTTNQPTNEPADLLLVTNLLTY